MRSLAAGRGARALALLAALALLWPAGCAGLRIPKPPDDPEALLAHDCKEPRSAIIGDAILLGASAIVLVLAGSSAISNGDDGFDGKLANGLWAIPAGVALLSGGSLFAATRRVNRCGHEKALLRAARLGPDGGSAPREGDAAPPEAGEGAAREREDPSD